MTPRRRLVLSAALTLAVSSSACDPEERPFERPTDIELVEPLTMEERREALRARQEAEEDVFAEEPPRQVFRDGNSGVEVITVERPVDPPPSPRRARDPLLDALDELDARDAEARRVAEWEANNPPEVTYEEVSPEVAPREEYRPDPAARIREAERADGIERETGYVARDSSRGRSLDDTSGSRVYSTQDSAAPERQVKPFIPGLPPIPGLPSIGSSGPSAEGLSEGGSEEARPTVTTPGALRSKGSVVVKP